MAHPVDRAVMSEARQAYVVVDLLSGPHVTPQLFASSGDWCMFLAAATTLKVQVLRQRPQIGVTFMAGARAVVMGGTAAVLDALRPVSVATNLRDVPVAGGFLPPLSCATPPTSPASPPRLHLRPPRIPPSSPVGC